MKLKKHPANAITSCRIVCSVLLLFFSVFSVQCCVLYLLCGVTDMIDGTVARKTNSDSEFGAQFDTVADFIFVAISFIKFLPLIHIPKWLWIWIVVIAIIKISTIVWGFIYKKKFLSLHTIMNKATGFALFLLPLTLPFVKTIYSLTAICVLATIAAIQEGYYIRIGREII